MTDVSITRALGAKRVSRLRETIATLKAMTADIPDHADWVLHRPVPLRATDTLQADLEMTQRLPNTGSWFYTVRYDSQGRRSGIATPYLRLPEPLSMDAIVGHIIFLDLHCRLGAWWLTHVWRAQQLTESSSSALHIWQIITAAACSRSLLEGAAAFSAETDAMTAEWDELKQMGVPTSDSISKFAAPLEKRISRGQFGTRLTESVDVKPPLQSTNVMTYVNKLAKQRPNDRIKEIYEWLCDAVHPSFGGMTVFVANQGAHFSETHNLARIAKDPLADKSYELAIEPTVANATADAIIVAADEIARQVPKIRWLVDDIGLTTRVAFTSTLDGHVGRRSEPKRNDRCPCGSGRKYKACEFHQWGYPGTPPTNQG